jgi:hypothetical protein
MAKLRRRIYFFQTSAVLLDRVGGMATARHTPGGSVYHALNHATARLRLFRKPADYDAFLRVFDEALAKRPLQSPWHGWHGGSAS